MNIIKNNFDVTKQLGEAMGVVILWGLFTLLSISLNAENISSINTVYSSLIETQLNHKTGQQTPIQSPKTSARYPKATTYNFDQNWRTAKETLSLTRIKNNDFIMLNSQANHYELEIKNHILKKLYKDRLSSHQLINAKITCNHPVTIKTWPLTFNTKTAKSHTIKLYDYDKNGKRQSLILNNPNTQCHFKSVKPYIDFQLIPEEIAFTQLQYLYSSFELCQLPNNNNLNGSKKLFTTSKYNSMSCPETVESIVPLEESYDGINARVESLLGKKLSKEFLDEQNPFVEIDFSKAPKLKAVFISYLVFRSDFFGHLIKRLLEHHAQNGVPIFIMVADSITLDKDHSMLNEFTRKYSNVKVKAFRYQPENWYSPKEWIKWRHRSLHIKLFITLSEDEQKNRVILGGRNIHDGFIYEEQPDHSWSSSLINYGEEESYIHWLDFDVLLTSRNFANKAASHFIRAWQQDYETYVVRSHNLNSTSKKNINWNFFDSKNPMVRHLMSFPFSDQQALESLYVEIFNSAKSSIRLVTPYFRVTKKLTKALKSAVDRGVQIELITRINLDGDTADIILSDVNKKGINTFVNKIKVYEYVKPKVILHSKLVTIDDNFSFVGSVNLNQRSFVHDLENALMIYDQNFNAYLKSLMQKYKSNSEEVTESLKVIWWKSLIIEMLGSAL